ncbi:Glucose 1-dehydrogenase 1 [Candidatus Rubidus massiliensis]|nr:Glucose 1-dehydrogenase 1 [Candidatus Rubidus massiliensis]
MPAKLMGKVAIVTGASKGIGAEIAKHFSKEGASVVVNYSTSQKEAELVVKEIVQNGGKAIAIQANLSKPADIPFLFKETIKQFGKVDILINNAGVYEFKPIEEITEEHYRRLFDLNVLGLVLASKEAVKNFGKDGGVIINISSVASVIARAEASIYSATKAAVDAITKALAKELGPRKIRVNSVNPGLVETEGVHSQGIIESDLRKEVEQKSPLRRIGQPKDIAPIVAFLASEDASWITGETFFVTGGPY